MSNNSQQVATNIIQQLGGNRFKAMTGAYHLAYTDEARGGLQFKFKGSRKANTVKIVLTDKDLYDLTFYKINFKTIDVKVVKEFKGIYHDMLKTCFEEVTELYVSL